MTPEEKARIKIDQWFADAGWKVVNREDYEPTCTAVAIREGLLKGNLEADYFLFINGKAVGVLEAKREETDAFASKLNGTVYKHEFDKRGLERSMLARLVTEGSLMLAPLMPWTTFGAFCMATLGISGLEFAPYAYLNYLSPLVSLVMTFLGIGVLWVNKANKGKRKFNEVV